MIGWILFVSVCTTAGLFFLPLGVAIHMGGDHELGVNTFAVGVLVLFPAAATLLLTPVFRFFEWVLK